jgi:hypothetical protein
LHRSADPDGKLPRHLGQRDFPSELQRNRLAVLVGEGGFGRGYPFGSTGRFRRHEPDETRSKREGKSREN